MHRTTVGPTGPLVLAVGLAVVLVLSGCGGSSKAGAAGSGSSTTSASSAGSSAAAGGPGGLTAAQITKVLPKAADLPKGWKVDPTNTLVEEAMTADPYIVEPEEPLTSVVAHMAEHKVGSAVVAHYGRLLGLFTTTDALRVLGVL